MPCHFLCVEVWSLKLPVRQGWAAFIKLKKQTTTKKAFINTWQYLCDEKKDCANFRFSRMFGIFSLALIQHVPLLTRDWMLNISSFNQ